MKKLLIFLMLFAFGFGAYCEESLLYNGDFGILTDNVDYFTAPQSGDYRVVLTITTFEKNRSTNTPVYLKYPTYYASSNNDTSLPSVYTKTLTLSAGQVLTTGITHPEYMLSLAYNIKVYGEAVGEAPVITSATSGITVTAGDSFSYTTTAIGTETIIFGSSLPSYLTGSGASISGTIPSDFSGNYFTFTVTATNDFGSDSKLVTVNVDPFQGDAPVITSDTSVSAKAGDSFSYKITATGDTPIYFTAEGFSAYLSFDGTDTVSGTLPYSSSSYSFTFDVTAANTAGNDLKTVTVVVSAAGLPVWDNPIEITKNVGDQLSVQVSPQWVSGAPVIDISVGSGSLPSFLSLNSNTLSGTCTTPGTYIFNLSASNPYGSANRDIKLTVNTVLNLPVYVGPVSGSSNNGLMNLVRGQPFSFDLRLVWDYEDSVTVSGLPSWASINDSVLSGTVPNDEIRQNVTGMIMTATNGSGDNTNTVNYGLEFSITGIGDSLYFTSPSTAQGTINEPFTYNATVNQPSGVSYSMSNAPDWLSCSSSGSVTGTVPEGITGFSFVITATHAELGSVSLTVNCTAVESGGEGVAKHVIVDNFSDFGSTQWATDMKGFLANSYQEFSYIKTGVNALNNRMEITNTKLDGIKAGTDGINTKLDITNGNLVVINETIESVDTHIVDGFDEVSDLLTDIKTKMNEQPVISSDGLDLPTYEFDTDFGEFTEAYTSTEIESKTEFSQFSFVKGELNDLLSVPPSDVVLSVPLTNLGVGFTENPTLNVSNDSSVAPYISFIRRFFDVIIWVVGCCWWFTIVAGFFV